MGIAFGTLTGRIRFKPASEGVRSPFLALMSLCDSTQLDQSVLPPLDLGMT